MKTRRDRCDILLRCLNTTHPQRVACAVAVCSLQQDIACKERAEREWARARNYFSLDVRLPPGDLRHSTIDESRTTHRTLTTHNQLIPAFQRHRLYRPSTNQTHPRPPVRSPELVIHLQPPSNTMAPSTFASAAAGSNQQNAQPREAGSEWYVYLSLCMHIQSPCPAMRSPSPSHPLRRTTRDASICANHLDF